MILDGLVLIIMKRCYEIMVFKKIEKDCFKKYIECFERSVCGLKCL